MKKKAPKKAAKAKKSHPVTLLHAGHPQAAKADNPGAQQRSHMDVIQAGRQRKAEICDVPYDFVGPLGGDSVLIHSAPETVRHRNGAV